MCIFEKHCIKMTIKQLCCILLPNHFLTTKSTYNSKQTHRRKNKYTQFKYLTFRGYNLFKNVSVF